MYLGCMKDEFRDGGVLYGLCSTYPASGIIEGMCPGWDFVWIDGQHGEHTNESIFHCAQASRAAGVHCMIRVAGHETAMLSLCADMAPSAIMIPMVNSAQQAESIVQALRFPPRGIRSYGGRAVIDLYGRDYHNKANPLIVAQIETEYALEHVQEIAAVEGIDVLFFSPDDMKLSKNINVNTRLLDDDALVKGIKTVSDAARKNGKYCGIVAPGAPERSFCVDMGYQLIVVGGDSGFIRTLSALKLSEIRDEKQHAGDAGGDAEQAK